MTGEGRERADSNAAIRTRLKEQVPCPGRGSPEQVREAVASAVLGFGPRPRVAYQVGRDRRVAVGRKGEPAERLRAELARIYGPVVMDEVPREDGAVAAYVASGGRYRTHARRLGIRDQVFLAKAADPVEVERSALLDDRQFEMLWAATSISVAPDGVHDVSLGDPGSWADDAEPVVITDPGGRAEQSPPLPMAIPKADGRGRHNLYFGFALDLGGGARWTAEDFQPPLRIALGGALNRKMGFGGSAWVNERAPYRGDGFHWGRDKPLAPRVVERDRGPACRSLEHPEPEGRWYPWLSSSSPVPAAGTWEAWVQRARVYERNRKTTWNREAERSPGHPPCGGERAEAA